MSYIGSTPTTQSFISGTDTFSGTGSQTNFTLSRLVNTVNDIQVVVNNVVQYPPNYSISGNTLTISPAPSAGTNNVYVRYLSTTLQTFAPSQGTVGLTQLSATGTPSASNFLRGDNTWAVAAPPVDTQTFNSSGTWTKPSTGDFVRIQMWGGGGGGSRSATATVTAAGGGGGYYETTIPIASMGATAAVTVGAAGVGRITSAGNGTAGGNSGVVLGSGATIYVSGGQGTNGDGGAGGYGAIVFTITALADATPSPVTTTIGAGGTGGGVAQDGYSYTGGGGGAGSSASNAGARGGWGGGGGTRGAGAGGTSLFGGAGGNSAGAGVQPGGGGGCSSSANTNATNGGLGQVIITTY